MAADNDEARGGLMSQQWCLNVVCWKANDRVVKRESKDGGNVLQCQYMLMRRVAEL